MCPIDITKDSDRPSLSETLRKLAFQLMATGKENLRKGGQALAVQAPAYAVL